jgi:hypothetical protein
MVRFSIPLIGFVTIVLLLAIASLKATQTLDAPLVPRIGPVGYHADTRFLQQALGGNYPADGLVVLHIFSPRCTPCKLDQENVFRNYKGRKTVIGLLWDPEDDRSNPQDFKAIYDYVLKLDNVHFVDLGVVAVPETIQIKNSVVTEHVRGYNQPK